MAVRSGSQASRPAQSWDAVGRRRSLRSTPAEGVAAWRDPLRRRMLAAADVLAGVGAVVAAGLVGGLDLTGLAISALVVPTWIVSAKALGLYDRDHARIYHPTSDEAARLLHAAVLCIAVVALAFALIPDIRLAPLSALTMGGGLLALVLLLRSGARAAWRRAVPAERTLMVGDGALAQAVARKLELERTNHLEIVHVLSPATFAQRVARSGGARINPPTELERKARDLQADRVILATEELDEAMLYEVLACCRARGLKLSVAPPLRAMLGTAVSLTHLAELPMIEFRTWDASRSTMLFKRTFDLAVGAGTLAMLAPLMVLLAVAIKLDSRGPVLYRQIRAGRHGVPFAMLKFRSMVSDADAVLADLVVLEELTEPMYKLRSDPRVTRLGRFLRRWSLDELPQLLNVIRGEMSIVGPRPEDARLVARYGEPELFRLQMRPGMTGPMQVHGRGDLTFQERLAVEREYIENYSFTSDLSLLMRTIGAVLRGHGAY